MPRICFNLNKDKVVTSSRMKEFQCNQFITKSHVLFARGLVSLRVQHWSAAVVSTGQHWSAECVQLTHPAASAGDASAVVKGNYLTAPFMDLSCKHQGGQGRAWLIPLSMCCFGPPLQMNSDGGQ